VYGLHGFTFELNYLALIVFIVHPSLALRLKRAMLVFYAYRTSFSMCILIMLTPKC